MGRSGSKEADLPLLTLLDLVDSAPANQATPAPALLPDHPAYADYEKLIPSERHVFIRRLIPPALAEFRQRLEESQRNMIPVFRICGLSLKINNISPQDKQSISITLVLLPKG